MKAAARTHDPAKEVTDAMLRCLSIALDKLNEASMWTGTFAAGSEGIESAQSSIAAAERAIRKALDAIGES